MIHLRLRHFSMQSFRRSEMTNFNEACKDVQLGPKEVAMFLSKSKDQLVFLFNPVKIKDRVIYDSRKLRLEDGEWDELFITYYAKRVGIAFVGLEKLAKLVLKKFGPKAV